METAHSDPGLNLERLLKPTVLGHFTHFEVTEIFIGNTQAQPVKNVFTILVAEERSGEAIFEPKFLGQRIKLEGMDNNRFFGIRRRICAVADGVSALNILDQTGEWKVSEEVLNFGTLHKLPTQFIPPDSTKQVAWNRVLKNNFWNGSYIFEWSDKEKKALDPLFADPRLLQELTDKVQAEIPIDIAALSDRLGNLVVQVPVKAIMSKFIPMRDGGCTISVAWHSHVPPRPLRAMCGYEFDGALTGFVMESIQAPETTLKTTAQRGTHGGVIWDEENGIVLAASGPTSFVEQFHLNVAPMDSEPRTLSFTDVSEKSINEKIGIMRGGPAMRIGNPHGDDNGGRTRNRLYRAGLEQLKRQKEFVPYGAMGLPPSEERKRALDDLKDLMRQHGRIGVWLWDPFLNSYDILETLVYCPYAQSEMRGLTAASGRLRNANPDPALTSKEHFISEQRAVLDGVTSNWRGVRFEFRARHGNVGWGFHDRFIIFPQEDGEALAWSLGTSINSLGGDHHILQKVSDGQHIMNAFKDLWDQLSGAEYLIWKKP